MGPTPEVGVYFRCIKQQVVIDNVVFFELTGGSASVENAVERRIFVVRLDEFFIGRHHEGEHIIE